jgi:protein-histidine N-methyltransferase
VLHLVTLPNFVLAWALHHKDSFDAIPALADAFSLEGEVELPLAVLDAFVEYLAAHQIELLFFSGGWGEEFAGMVRAGVAASVGGGGDLLVLGSETIYSPFALRGFADTVFQLLRAAKQGAGESSAACIVAAKRLYFGVGGSLDDFVDLARSMDADVAGLREETEGVRRGVVQVVLK